MSLSIRTNVASLDAQRNLSQTQISLDSSLAKLSSGYRITKAGDDAAGLGISTRLDAQYRSYNQAIRNANDGLSVVQSAEAGFNEISNIVARLRELAIQGGNDTLGTDERSYITKEATALTTEIDRIANSTEFNGIQLLNTAGTTLKFQVGIHDDASGFDTISVASVDVQATGLGIAFDVTDGDAARATLGTLDAALNTLSGARADFGAAGNRLQSTINAVQTFAEATAAANSRVRDVDVAEETAKMTRSQILAQAGISVLAQANQMPQLALKLLG